MPSYEIAGEYGVTVTTAPWARETKLVDPDGNRLRIAERVGNEPTPPGNALARPDESR